MSKASDYREYAAEGIELARTATSEDVRKHFLDLAKLWRTAAQQMDDGFEATPLDPDEHPQR